MADSVTYRLLGGAELERDLNELKADLRRRVVRAGLRDAAKPIAQAARVFALPRDFSSKTRVAGTMRKAIGVFGSKRYKVSQGAIGVFITVRASKAQRRARPITGDPFYWRWIEGGHKIVPRGKKGAAGLLRGRGRATGISRRRRAATGMVKPYPFFGPAFRTQGNNALRNFESAIRARIAKANARR